MQYHAIFSNANHAAGHLPQVAAHLCCSTLFIFLFYLNGYISVKNQFVSASMRDLLLAAHEALLTLSRCNNVWGL